MHAFKRVHVKNKEIKNSAYSNSVTAVLSSPLYSKRWANVHPHFLKQHYGPQEVSDLFLKMVIHLYAWVKCYFEFISNLCLEQFTQVEGTFR